jgi:hypothetical protein
MRFLLLAHFTIVQPSFIFLQAVATMQTEIGLENALLSERSYASSPRVRRITNLEHQAAVL